MCIESIELVFENYESLKIQWEHIIEIRIQGQIKTKFSQQRGFYECIEYLLMRIDGIANIHHESGKEPWETTAFQRIDWNDILYIIFIDKDKAKNRTIYVPWQESDAKGLIKYNLVQHTVGPFSDGSLQVRIGD